MVLSLASPSLVHSEPSAGHLPFLGEPVGWRKTFGEYGRPQRDRTFAESSESCDLDYCPSHSSHDSPASRLFSHRDAWLHMQRFVCGLLHDFLGSGCVARFLIETHSFADTQRTLAQDRPCSRGGISQILCESKTHSPAYPCRTFGKSSSEHYTKSKDVT